MAVIINFWKGTFGYTAYNVIYGLNVGHVSMHIINDKNPTDEIYISHHPKIENSIAFLPNPNKYASLQSIIVDSFIPREKPISFKKDCARRNRKPDDRIVIYGLNESRIREFYQKYLQNDLSEEKTQYHCLKNNCCTVVAYLICKGLDYFQKNSKFCSPSTYQTDSFFAYDSNIEKLIVAFNKKCWSPRSLKSFVKKVKKKTDKKSSVLNLPVRQKISYYSGRFSYFFDDY
ncbi:MAG: hypothetical protein F6K40_20075 [Okeania sp. SIO3I5]|uniref:hypothetical protein n=1 Tax=Okeania sp. SIO3I5 TaxID=2607805 RepID=UPI0013BB8AD0|nr:hypothetical protein [Okeania sp. SIO3I5]NEQ38439.1 hypothetical protein [Okeania sp. SIO3I5]